MSSSLQVGLRCARLCAFRGLLLRWLLLLCHSRHGRRPGPQKTTQQQHKRAASLGWGFAALAAGLPGCGGCCRATRTPDQQQQHKRAPSLGWGFAALANAPTGCCCGGCCCYATAGTTEGRAHKRQHNSSTKEQLLWGGASLRSPLAFRGAKDNTTAAQKSSFFGVGLRCARRWPSGVLLRWILLLLPGYSNRGPLPDYSNRGPLPDYSNRGPLPGYSNRGPLPGYSNRGPLPGYSNRGLLRPLPLLLRPLPFSPPPSPRLAVNHNARLWLLKNIYYVNK